MLRLVERCLTDKSETTLAYARALYSDDAFLRGAADGWLRMLAGYHTRLPVLFSLFKILFDCFSDEMHKTRSVSFL